MSATESVRINEEILFPDIALLDRSTSFHSSPEGKIWIRLLIHLCWWLHDMYEIDGNDPNAKLNYIENKLAQCKSLFPARFVLMFSNSKFVPTEQHPFLICRQDEHKTVLLVFRATVSSKSIQDVFTDIQFYSNCQVYEGDRHAGFAKRAESGPLLAVVNWLQQGWKVIVTGHSLGGAVSQLFTSEVIKSLVEIGLTTDQVVLRCVTFGVPQCADHHFWSSYSAWYDVFDSYIYENDAIFRLVTFGADKAKNTTNAFVRYIGNIGRKIIEYTISDSLPNVLHSAADQIGNIINDALIPTYSVFGRHHFIIKGRSALLEIISIGESCDEKERLINDLINGTNRWYDCFIEKQLIPAGPFKFVYREFLNHGCYPFAINQLFNEEATRRLGNGNFPTQTLLRSPIGNGYSKSIFNLSAFIYSRNEIDQYPDYIYLKGFLVDFIRFVILPIELAESQQYQKQRPVMTQEQSDGRAVLCFRSTQSIEFIKRHKTFFLEVTTFFNSFYVQVAVLSNSTNSTFPKVYDLDPVSTVLRAYHELVLDASSAEQYNGSPLSRCFSIFFNAFKLIDHDEGDKMLARYLAELQSSNYLNDIEKYLENLKMPQSEDEVYRYFENELILLKKTSEDVKYASDETRKTAEHLYQALSSTLISHFHIQTQRNVSVRFDEFIHSISSRPTLALHRFVMLLITLPLLDSRNTSHAQLTPLHLEFTELRQYLHELHTRREVDDIQNILKSVMASVFFIKIKLNRLAVVFKNYSWLTREVLQTYERIIFDIKAIRNPFHYSPWASNKILVNEVRTTLIGISTSLLLSVGENVNKNENEWQFLIRISGCHWLHEITNVKTEQERDAVWNQTFTNAPLKNVPNEHRWNWIGLIRLCSQLNLMREILIRKSPKVVISGRSQTGKSTLFKYLTGRNLDELRNIDAFNTRMSLQCPTLIQFNNNKDNKDESGLVIDVVDNPGQDDATRQAKNLLDMTLHSASLFIVVTTLADVNQQHTIDFIDKLLRDTQVNILILINQVDIRLFEEWEKFKNKSSNNDESNNYDWEQIEETAIHNTTESRSDFNACDTVKKLIERPKRELMNGLKTDQVQIDNRVTVKSIILKDFPKSSMACIHLQSFAQREEHFLSQVSKSYVNTWIIENLTKPAV